MDKDLSAFTQEQIDEAKNKGTIKVAEILVTVADTDLSIEKINKVCEALERNGIEIATEHADIVFDISEEDICKSMSGLCSREPCLHDSVHLLDPWHLNSIT